jgi:hypothetical protein
MQNFTYNTCAVVGNGGSVLLYGLGEEINRHDAIIRFNKAPVRTYEPHVGNRTTCRIVNRNHIGFVDRLDEIVLQQVTAPEAVETFVQFMEQRQRSSTATAPIYAIDPDFHAQVLEEYRDSLQVSHMSTFRCAPQLPNAKYRVVAERQVNTVFSLRSSACTYARTRYLTVVHVYLEAPSYIRNFLYNFVTPSYSDCWHRGVYPRVCPTACHATFTQRPFRGTLLSKKVSVQSCHSLIFELLNILACVHVQHATRQGLSADTPPTNGFYGVTLALQRCQRVTLFGFARQWTPRLQLQHAEPPTVQYHYFDAEEPYLGQHARDDAEFLALLYLFKKHATRIRFGEPCMSGCEIDICRNCPRGSQCSCGLWYPVPKRGYCYRHRSIGCFHRCQNAKDCLGGQNGECPFDESLFDMTCTK